MSTEKKQTNEKSGEQKFTAIQNLIILDRSGSMSSIANEAIAGVNETVGTIRAAQKNHPDLKQYLTVVSFCGCSLKTFVYNQPIDDVPVMTPKDYRPCCSTPLYDTMGECLTKMREHVGNRNDIGVSITIITDGYENASRKWTGAQIKALVELLKADGWLFAFIGANQDVREIKFNLSIDNVMAFEATEDGTKEMFDKERKARMAWSSKMACAMPASFDRNINNNYFNEDED